MTKTRLTHATARQSKPVQSDNTWRCVQQKAKLTNKQKPPTKTSKQQSKERKKEALGAQARSPQGCQG